MRIVEELMAENPEGPVEPVISRHEGKVSYICPVCNVTKRKKVTEPPPTKCAQKPCYIPFHYPSGLPPYLKARDE